MQKFVRDFEICKNIEGGDISHVINNTKTFTLCPDEDEDEQVYEDY